MARIAGGDVLDPDYGADPVGGWYGERGEFVFLARFLNDDLDCNGKDCSGSIEKSDWLMRVMVGWEF